MNFKFGEIIETEKFQFVRIHKNGNKSVVKCIENSFKEEEISYVFRLSSKPRFCIIRDPYERFISGLKYDLSRSTIDIKDIEEIFGEAILSIVFHKCRIYLILNVVIILT